MAPQNIAVRPEGLRPEGVCPPNLCPFHASRLRCRPGLTPGDVDFALISSKVRNDVMKTSQLMAFFLGLVWLTAGCSAQDFRASPTPTTAAVDVAAQAVDTATPTPLPPTVTAIPAPSPSATFAPPTPIPTRAIELPAPPVAPSPVTSDLEPGGPASQVEVIFVGLNIRSGPGVAFEIIGELALGDQVDVAGVNPERTWYQVVVPEEARLGWISASSRYTRLVGDVADLPVVAPAAPAEAAAETGSPVTAGSIAGKLILQVESGGDIYLVNADASDLRLLATGIDPALSPDGTKIAYTRWDNNEFGSIWIYDLESGTEQVVLGETRQAKSPAWSPDGRFLIVNFQHGGFREVRRVCHSYRFDQEIPLPPSKAFNITIVREADEIKVCYSLPPDPHWGLRKIELASGDFEDLASDTYAYSPVWDPLNEWRIFYDGDNGLMQLDVNRNVQWPLTTDVRDHNPAVSPDGAHLAVSYKQHDHWEVYTIDLADGSRARLTRPPLLADRQYSSAAPAWSPDGNQIAYVTDRNGQWEYWVMNANGSAQRPLLPPGVASRLEVKYNSVDERLIVWGR
jgi:hypothetical protein